MSKRQVYYYTFAAAIIILLVGFFMHITTITKLAHSTAAMMQNPLVFGPAAICAFIFMGNSNYWLINLGCALAASLIIQYFVIGHGAGLYTIMIRAFAFLVVVYILNLIKVFINK